MRRTPAADWRVRLAAPVRARPALARWLLAGPGAALVSLATLAAMPLWLPAGADAVIVPVVAAPLVWAGAFFYACLVEDVARAAAVMLAAGGLQATAVALT